jgi:hypothetical protein
MDFTNSKAFDKLADDMQNNFKQFEAEIRKDEREKVIQELINMGLIENNPFENNAEL